MNFDYFLSKATTELLGKECQKMIKGGSCPLRLPPWITGMGWGNAFGWMNGNGSGNGGNSNNNSSDNSGNDDD